MTVSITTVKIGSKGENDLIDLTEEIWDFVSNSAVFNGIVTIFVSGQTGSTTIEFELGLIRGFPDMLSRVDPQDLDYDHKQMWYDRNGHSHVKASLVEPSLTVPFSTGQISLGIWQHTIFLELDTRCRIRNLVLQIIGE